MKFLADENFPGVALRTLHQRGIDIRVVPGGLKGTADAELLQYVKRESRVLVTMDKDFGELIFRRFHGTLGIVFFRLPDLPAPASIDRIVTILASGAEFTGRFTTVEENKIRTRVLSSIGMNENEQS